MELGLAGRAALVSGASKGIGFAIAKELAREGVDIAICARTPAAVEAAARTIGNETGRTVIAVSADLSKPDGPAQFVRAALAALGHVDILVNNAGATQRGDFLTLDDEVWSSGFALKHTGYVRLARTSWPYLPRNGHGRIINIIGGAGRTPSADFMIGGSVNAALLNFTKALALLAGPERIRVNGVSPGAVLTDRHVQRVQQTASDRGLTYGEVEREILASHPLGEIGSPEQIAALVAFLCSDLASFIHGTTIAIDGGATPCI